MKLQRRRPVTPLDLLEKMSIVYTYTIRSAKQNPAEKRICKTKMRTEVECLWALMNHNSKCFLVVGYISHSKVVSLRWTKNVIWSSMTVSSWVYMNIVMISWHCSKFPFFVHQIRKDYKVNDVRKLSPNCDDPFT